MKCHEYLCRSLEWQLWEELPCPLSYSTFITSVFSQFIFISILSMSDLTSANSLVRPLHCLQSTPCHQQKAGHPHSLASFTILSKISHGESATLPYTLIHFKPLLMFLPHLHSHLTLHVQKLYCPHKLLSHLSLCQSFPQLHSVHSVIRFLRSKNAINDHLVFNCCLHNLPQTIHIRALSP